MQRWDDAVAAAPPAIKREALRVRGAVAQLWSRFPCEYHNAFANLGSIVLVVGHDSLTEFANMTCDILWYLHNTVEAANLVQRGAVVCSALDFLHTIRDSESRMIGTVAVKRRVGHKRIRIHTTDEKRVVPCTLSRDLFDHHRPEAICCSCGKLTRDATLCRCGAHVRCSEEACAACEAQCGISLQRRADILAQMREGSPTWPFTQVGYFAGGEERFFPVPLAHVFLHGIIYRLPTTALVGVGISDESRETMASQCPLVGADIASYIFAASGRPDYGSRRNRCLAIKR